MSADCPAQPQDDGKAKPSRFTPDDLPLPAQIITAPEAAGENALGFQHNDGVIQSLCYKNHMVTTVSELIKFPVS